MSLGRLGAALGFRLRRVQNQLSRDFQTRSKRWDLRAGMFSALEIMSANPGISQTDLSREVGQDKSVMVTLIDDLERRGWTVRERSATDRRRYRLSITAAGAKVLDELVADMQHIESVGLGALTPDELQTMVDALDKVYRAYVRAQPAAPKKD
ncbi:MAG: MarR family transcriptional regulator [Pseudomonadota bacterium]